MVLQKEDGKHLLILYKRRRMNWGGFLSVCFFGFIFVSRVLSDRDLFPVENA